MSVPTSDDLLAFLTGTSSTPKSASPKGSPSKVVSSPATVGSSLSKVRKPLSVPVPDGVVHMKSFTFNYTEEGPYKILHPVELLIQNIRIAGREFFKPPFPPVKPGSKQGDFMMECTVCNDVYSISAQEFNDKKIRIYGKEPTPIANPSIAVVSHGHSENSSGGKVLSVDEVSNLLNAVQAAGLDLGLGSHDASDAMGTLGDACFPGTPDGSGLNPDLDFLDNFGNEGGGDEVDQGMSAFIERTTKESMQAATLGKLNPDLEEGEWDPSELQPPLVPQVQQSNVETVSNSIFVNEKDSEPMEFQVSPPHSPVVHTSSINAAPTPSASSTAPSVGAGTVRPPLKFGTPQSVSYSDMMSRNLPSKPVEVTVRSVPSPIPVDPKSGGAGTTGSKQYSPKKPGFTRLSKEVVEVVINNVPCIEFERPQGTKRVIVQCYYYYKTVDRFQGYEKGWEFIRQNKDKCAYYRAFIPCKDDKFFVADDFYVKRDGFGGLGFYFIHLGGSKYPLSVSLDVFPFMYRNAKSYLEEKNKELFVRTNVGPYKPNPYGPPVASRENYVLAAIDMYTFSYLLKAFSNLLSYYTNEDDEEVYKFSEAWYKHNKEVEALLDQHILDLVREEAESLGVSTTKQEFVYDRNQSIPRKPIMRVDDSPAYQEALELLKKVEHAGRTTSSKGKSLSSSDLAGAALKRKETDSEKTNSCKKPKIKKPRSRISRSLDSDSSDDSNSGTELEYASDGSESGGSVVRRAVQKAIRGGYSAAPGRPQLGSKKRDPKNRPKK